MHHSLFLSVVIQFSVSSRLGMKEISLFFMNNRFVQVIQDVEAISLATNEHPVALLAERTGLLQRDNTIYMPILSQRHQNAAAVSASTLHKLYGIKLVSND